MFYPSIIAHVFSGLLLFISIGISLLYFSKLQSLDIYRILILILLLSIALGIHGISHVLLEKEYNYNLLEMGKRAKA